MKSCCKKRRKKTKDFRDITLTLVNNNFKEKEKFKLFGEKKNKSNSSEKRKISQTFRRKEKESKPFGEKEKE